MKYLSLISLLFVTTLSWAADNQPLQLKFEYTETVLMKSESAKRVDASDNQEAKEKMAKARDLYKKARRSRSEGRNAQAEKYLNEALRMATIAKQMVPDPDRISQQLKERYDDLLRQVRSYRDWHVDYKGLDPHEKEDERKIEEEMEKAQLLADAGSHQQANEILNNMLGILITKTHAALGSKTITYDLNFASKEEEYNYELDSNLEYERLIPIALTQKQPNETMKGLMDKMVDKALLLRKDSELAFKEKREEEAIKLIHQSTEQFQNALKVVGVR